MSAKITEAQVRHIALLSRLKPTDDEVHLLGEQLSAILAYVDQLNEVDTTDVRPTAHALPINNVLRADQPGTCFSPEQALANAPQREETYFAVPKVLDQDHGS